MSEKTTNQYHHWTMNQKKLLVIYSALGFSAKEIAREMGRTPQSVRDFSYHHNIKDQALIIRNKIKDQLIADLEGESHARTIGT